MTTRTFDFRSSMPFAPPGFDNAAYVEIVCRGLAREFGEISAFVANGEALSPEKLATCNGN